MRRPSCHYPPSSTLPNYSSNKFLNNRPGKTTMSSRRAKAKPRPQFSLQSFSKWFQLKIYQIEVTFSVYMFTPWEKFIFWSVIFLISSLTLVATILYLPQHIAFILGRLWFYIHGDTAELVGRHRLGEGTAKAQVLQVAEDAVVGSAVTTATAVAAAVTATLRAVNEL